MENPKDYNKQGLREEDTTVARMYYNPESKCR